MKIVLAFSHLAALAAGIWWSGIWSPSGRGDSKGGEKSSSEEVTPQHRISSRQLLGAFKFDSPFFPKTPSSFTAAGDLSPEEKAAAVIDFRAEMQSQVDVFNQTGLTDYRFTQELIYRWMSLNPKEAMGFFAKVEIRSGWGDPWPALFKNPCAMNSLDLAKHIDQNWLRYNRSRGLKALAESVAKGDPAQLPAILEVLADKDREVSLFLSEAVRSARPEDFAEWLEVTDGLEGEKKNSILQTLAGKMVPSSVPPTWYDQNGRGSPSQSQLAAILEQSRGTEIESLIQTRVDRLFARFEKEKQERAAQAAHAGVAGGEEIRPPERIQRGFAQKLEKYRTLELRAVVQGKQSATQALENQVTMIDEGIVEGQRGNWYRRLLTETMLVDPVAAFEFGKERFSMEEMGRAFRETSDVNIYSVKARSKMLDQLFETDHWEKIPNRFDYLGDVVDEYRNHHVKQSAAWVRSLPDKVVGEIRKNPRRDSWLLKYLEEVRGQ